MGGHPLYRQLQAVKNLVVLKWFFAWICKEALTWFCFCLHSSTSRLGKLKSRATNQDQWWPLHQRFSGVRGALPPCSFTTISDFPSAFFACFAQHYSIFLLLIIFLGTHFTHALGVEVSHLRREGHTNPLNRLRKRLGTIKIQILYTCSPVTLTEVEGGISEQIRRICVSNSQGIFHSTLSWRMNVKLSVAMCGEGRQRGRRDNI